MRFINIKRITLKDKGVLSLVFSIAPAPLDFEAADYTYWD